MFLPSPSDLLVNLSDCKPLVEQLLSELPSMFKESYSTESALGAALQAAYKMASPTGKSKCLIFVIYPDEKSTQVSQKISNQLSYERGL